MLNATYDNMCGGNYGRKEFSISFVPVILYRILSNTLYEKTKEVLYILCDNQKISTSIPMKEIMTMLPEKDFVSIQKGVIVAVKQILDISNSGVYTMTDGKTIQGRKRYLSEHKNRRAALALHVADAEGKLLSP